MASGKVLLAALAEREVLRIVRRGLVSYTERTITELEPLLEELARIRRRGYATAIGEYELGLNAVAAPVHDARGQRHRRGGHLGTGLPPHPAADPGAGGPGPRGRGRHLRPARRHAGGLTRLPVARLTVAALGYPVDDARLHQSPWSD